VIDSPVPPPIAQRWIATPGEDDTDTAVCAASQPTVSASSTTTPAQLDTCTAACATNCDPMIRSESSTPFAAAMFEIVIGPEVVSTTAAPVPSPITCRFAGAEAPIENAA
jgi:hypothetical protein